MRPGMLVYAYVRMSTTAQAEKVDGDSERRQMEDVRSWAARNGHTLVEKPLRDLGVSAYRGSNQRKGAALGEFLSGLKEGKLEPGILYLEAVDRLSRENPLRILTLMSEIFDTGSTLYVRSLGQIIDQKNFHTTLFPALSLMAQVAHYESAQKSQRVSAAIAERQKRARIDGKRSKGKYHPSWIGHRYHDGKVEHYLLPGPTASIRRIYDLAIAGMGTRAIARVLNEEKAPIPPAPSDKSGQGADRRWHAKFVGTVLTSRAVLGEYQPTTTRRTPREGDQPDKIEMVPAGDPISGYWPAAVTQEQWDAVRSTANRKLGGKVGGRKGTFSNLLTNGIARCAHCGRNMLIRSCVGQDNKQYYLRCSNAEQGVACENTRYARVDWVEPKLLGALSGVPWSRLIRNIPVEDQTATVTAQIDEIAKRIDTLSRSSARLLRVIENEDEPDPEILARRREIQGEIANLKTGQAALVRDRDALRRNAAANAGAVDEAVELARLMREATGTKLYEIRQRIHTLLREIIEVAKFDMIAGVARVEIRGGMTLTIPIDKSTPPTAEFTGTFHDLAAPRPGAEIPRLKPDKAKRRLVEAHDPASYSMVVEGVPAPWPRPAA